MDKMYLNSGFVAGRPVYLARDMDTACNNSDNVRPRKDVNENNGPFTIEGRLKSVRHAFYGVGLMLKSQHNAWLHAFATISTLVVGLLCGLSDGEWCWIILAIMAVWTAEALNTALEFLADVASSEFHPLIRQAKDVAAGGVLISAIGSVIIGLLVIVPHLIHCFGRLF
jgi:diacylglycerol kinase (ATP)